MNTIALLLRSRTAWLFLSVGLAALIAALTFMPQVQMPSGARGMDKIYHGVAFAVLVFPTAVLRPHHWRGAASIAILYGAIIEIIQPAFWQNGQHD